MAGEGGRPAPAPQQYNNHLYNDTVSRHSARSGSFPTCHGHILIQLKINFLHAVNNEESQHNNNDNEGGFKKVTEDAMILDHEAEQQFSVLEYHVLEYHASLSCAQLQVFCCVVSNV